MRTRAALGPRRAALLLAGAFATGAAVIGAVATVRGTFEDPAFAVLASYGTLLYAFVGVVVLWRLPGQGVGRLALAIGVAFAVSLILAIASNANRAGTVRTILPAPQQALLDVAGGASSVLLTAGLILGASLLITWFPDGHRTSRLGGLVEAILVVSVVAVLLSSLRDPIIRQVGWSPSKDATFAALSTVGIGGLVLVYLGAFVDLGLRYRRADATRRIQIRWVWAAEALSVALSVAVFSVGGQLDWLWFPWIASFSLPVLAIAIAITRYRLYDIDRIVSRSISYVVVTAVLVVLFAIVTLVLQAGIGLAVAAPGTELDPRVVAVSTLVVAASFNPLRSRVQAVVDRRFHRERYDTGRIMAGFSGRLRDELDLVTVSGELRSTADRALEPTLTGVWLRTPPKSR